MMNGSWAACGGDDGTTVDNTGLEADYLPLGVVEVDALLPATVFAAGALEQDGLCVVFCSLGRRCR